MLHPMKSCQCSKAWVKAGATAVTSSNVPISMAINPNVPVIIRDTAGAHRSARRTNREIHKPFKASGVIMPTMKATPRKAENPQLAVLEPPSEKNAAWLSVSNEIAKSPPTPKMSHGRRT